MAQTATERLNKTKSPKVVVLEQDFAGIRAGSTMFVATPKIVDECVKTIPPGRFITMPELRADLAIAYDCDARNPRSKFFIMSVKKVKYPA
ncbi:MAG: hypothetical protein GWP50_00030 [Proteobacteria bacterium]|nr:hypothetical protein [Pseudomonadota bacterium]